MFRGFGVLSFLWNRTLNVCFYKKSGSFRTNKHSGKHFKMGAAAYSYFLNLREKATGANPLWPLLLALAILPCRYVRLALYAKGPGGGADA